MALLGALLLFKSLTIETEGGDPIGDLGLEAADRDPWAPWRLFGLLLPRLGMIAYACRS